MDLFIYMPAMACACSCVRTSARPGRLPVLVSLSVCLRVLSDACCLPRPVESGRRRTAPLRAEPAPRPLDSTRAACSRHSASRSAPATDRACWQTVSACRPTGGLLVVFKWALDGCHWRWPLMEPSTICYTELSSQAEFGRLVAILTN